MSLIDEIKIKSLSEAHEILKAAGEEDLFEKAHKDGDLHPNGKWVWVSSAAGGKGDWRTLNGRTHKKHQAANAAGRGSSSASSTTTTTPSSTKQTNVKQKDESSKSKKSALPDTMLEIHGDMDEKYGDEIRPFIYTSNGVKDLTDKDKKGFAVWVGFEHEMRGRQPVNREKMKNFINDTAIPNFLNEIYKRTGKKFKKEDVKIDDYWNNTDMFRIHLLTDKTENGAIKEGESNKTSGSKTSSTISLKSPSKVFKKIPAKNSDELYKKTLSYLGGRISAKTNNGLIEGTIQNSTKKDDRVVLTIKKDDGSLTKISTSILGTSKYQAPQPDASKIKEIKDSKKGVGIKISSAVGATDWSTVNYLINSGMEIQYQHGLSFRRGSNSFKKISAEEALEKMHQNATFDAGVKDGILYINTYSGFDMD